MSTNMTIKRPTTSATMPKTGEKLGRNQCSANPKTGQKMAIMHHCEHPKTGHKIAKKQCGKNHIKKTKTRENAS